MSHHLFLLSPSDTPLYSLTHHSTKPVSSVSSPLAANLPTWSTSAFAGTLTALSGASSAPQHTTGGSVRMGGGQDRHVIQMIANASLDVIEDVMRKENTMCVQCCTASTVYYYPMAIMIQLTLTGISSQLTSSMNGRCLLLLRQEVRNIDFIALLCTCWIESCQIWSLCCCMKGRTMMESSRFSWTYGSCMLRLVVFARIQYMRENWPFCRRCWILSILRIARSRAMYLIHACGRVRKSI